VARNTGGARGGGVSSLDLQKAVVARLKADAGVTALVGQRIYDRVPPDAVFPYVSLGRSKLRQAELIVMTVAKLPFRLTCGRERLASLR
jgi:hypothetical protein